MDFALLILLFLHGERRSYFFVVFTLIALGLASSVLKICIVKSPFSLCAFTLDGPGVLVIKKPGFLHFPFFRETCHMANEEKIFVMNYDKYGHFIDPRYNIFQDHIMEQLYKWHINKPFKLYKKYRILLRLWYDSRPGESCTWKTR